MIKSLTLSTLIVGMYQNPVYALLMAIALVFLIDLQRLDNKERASNLQYEGVKEIFNDPTSENYIEPKVTDTKIEVVPVEIKPAPLYFANHSYKEIQSLCKSVGITKRNRKRTVLEQELLSIC